MFVAVLASSVISCQRAITQKGLRSSPMRSPLYLGIVDEHNDSLDGEGLLASSRLSIADAYQGFGVVRTHVFSER